MMSRADFTALADAFNDSYADHNDQKEIECGVDVALANVTEALIKLNPRFKPDLFIEMATQKRSTPVEA